MSEKLIIAQLLWSTVATIKCTEHEEPHLGDKW
jgi:hypothetical protein